MTIEELVTAIARVMRRVDEEVTPSLYFAGRGNDDRPADNNDYATLWDALLELNAAAPDLAAKILDE